MEKLKVDHVYVAHVKKGYEDRKAFMDKQLTDFGISFDYMLDGDVSDISDERLREYFKDKLVPVSPQTSCTMKHLLIYEKIIKDRAQLALVFEDDIVLKSNFIEIFNQSIDEINQRTDIDKSKLFVSYEDTTLRFVDRKELKEEKLLYKQPNGRCAGAYLVSLEMAQAIIDYVKANKCHIIIDWFHNFLAEKDLLQFYWCEPAIADQGSHSGMFESGLSHKNQTFFRRLKWKVNSVWKRNTK
jgi:glycosyl transferase family 25